MMRSMYAAISGLRNHQSFMDVVGNNIANVNTTAFKASRVTFQDILSQTIRGASAPQDDRGGVNPMQIGSGMTLAGIETIQTQGNTQPTGRLEDMAIQGEGYFMVSDGTQTFYTRDGSFARATDGTLVSASTGLRVLGWQAADGVVDTGQPVGSLRIPLGEAMMAQPSTELTIRGNLNANQPSYGSVTKSNSSGGTGTVSGTFTGATSLPYVVRIASVNAATGEVTGIEVSTDGGVTFGGVIATGGGNAVAIGNGLNFAIQTATGNTVGDTYSFQSQVPQVTTSTTVYDSLGIGHVVTFTFTKTGAANTWTWLATSNEAGVTITPNVPTNVVFSGNGNYIGGTPAAQIQMTLTNGATSPLTFNLDLSGLTQLSSNSEVNASSDGAPAGSLTTFTVTETGEIIGIYSNGLKQTLGQIALAAFANPGGLMKAGSNLYEISPNSGDPVVGTPGTGGRGTIATGFLEMSNVDLAQEFTNMILSQRGFQANSRIITASDEILQELVNLKR